MAKHCCNKCSFCVIIRVLATGKHKLSLHLHPMVHPLIPKQSRVTHSQYWQIFFLQTLLMQTPRLPVWFSSRPQSMWTTNLTNPSTLYLFSPHRRQTWASGITLGEGTGEEGDILQWKTHCWEPSWRGWAVGQHSKEQTRLAAVNSLPVLLLQLCRVWRSKASPIAETESWFLLHLCF